MTKCPKANKMNECTDRDCRDGIYKKIEEEFKILARCMTQYIKKPHIAIVVVILGTLLTITGTSITTSYKVWNAPNLYADDKKVTARVNEIEKNHALWEAAVKQQTKNLESVVATQNTLVKDLANEITIRKSREESDRKLKHDIYNELKRLKK